MTATLLRARHAHRTARPALGPRPHDRLDDRVSFVEPNYLARRVVAVIVALAVLAALVVMVGTAIDAVTDLGGRPAAASEVSSAAPAAAVTHVAAPGDTMWSIADRYRGDVDRGRYLDALIRLNGGTDILAGQAVRLP